VLRWSVDIATIRGLKPLSNTDALLLDGPSPCVIVVNNVYKLCDILDNAHAQSDGANDNEYVSSVDITNNCYWNRDGSLEIYDLLRVA